MNRVHRFYQVYLPNSRINNYLRKCITLKVYLEHGKRKKHLGNLLADLCKNGWFKEIWVTFKYLEYSDFQIGGESAVFMLCLAQRVALQRLGKEPGISGLAVAREVLWRRGWALLLPSLRLSLPAPNPLAQLTGSSSLHQEEREIHWI